MGQIDLQSIPLSPDALQDLLQQATAAALEKVKREKYEKSTDYERYLGRPVEFIEEQIGTAVTPDQRSICQSVEDNVVTIAKSGNAVGKTHISAHIAAYFLLCRPNSQVFVAAAPPESNLKRLLWGEIIKITRARPHLFHGMKIAESMVIEKTPGVFIAGVTIPSQGTEKEREARFSGKHAPNLLFILDEADAIPDPVFRGIEGCMSGGHTRMLCLFNPRARYGPVYNMERHGTGKVVSISAFTHPNVVTGENLFPGAVDRETTVRRINEWTRPLNPNEVPDSECYQVPDFLIGQVAVSKAGDPYPPIPAGWRRVMESQFSYAVIANYPASDSNQLINEDWVAKARSRYDLYVAKYGEIAPVAARCTMGVDVGEFGGDQSTVCKRYGNFVTPIVAWSDVDTLITAAKAADLYDSSVGSVLVDATGVGSAVAPAMEREIKKAGHEIRFGAVKAIKVAKAPTFEVPELGQFYQLRDQLYWSIRDWLRDEEAMLPPDQELIDELMALTYEITLATGKIKVCAKDIMRQRLGRSPDKMDSLAMTFAPGASQFRVAFVNHNGSRPPRGRRH